MRPSSACAPIRRWNLWLQPASHPIVSSTRSLSTTAKATTKRGSILASPRRQWTCAASGAALEKTRRRSREESEEDGDSSRASSLSEQVRLLMRGVPHPVAIITATQIETQFRTTSCNGSAAYSFKGMTVSSFNTVTLSPEPIISFNVRRPSETLAALTSSGRFLVHLLAPTCSAAALARHFSRGNQNLSAVFGGGSSSGTHAEFEFTSYFPSLDDHVVVADCRTAPARLPLPALRRRRRACSAMDLSQSEKELQAEAAVAEDDDSVESDETKRNDRNDQKGVVDFPFIFECVLHPQQLNVYDHTVVLGTVVKCLPQQQQPQPRPRAADNRETDSPMSSASLCLTYADTRFWKMGTHLL